LARRLRRGAVAAREGGGDDADADDAVESKSRDLCVARISFQDTPTIHTPRQRGGTTKQTDQPLLPPPSPHKTSLSHPHIAARGGSAPRRCRRHRHRRHRRRSSPARHGRARSVPWEQSTHAASPPLIATTATHAMSAQRAGRARTASSPFIASPCTACTTAAVASVREREQPPTPSRHAGRPTPPPLPTLPSCAWPAIRATRRQSAAAPASCGAACQVSARLKRRTVSCHFLGLIVP